MQGDVAAMGAGDVAGDGEAEARSARILARVVQRTKGLNTSSRRSGGTPGPSSSMETKKLRVSSLPVIDTVSP